MKSNFDAELQTNSDTENENDMTDEHIRALTASLAADVPPNLKKNVMSAIRAERKRIAFRRRFIRLGSAVAAALVIVPMAAVVVPVMIRQEKNMDEAPRAEDVLHDAVAEPNVEDSHLYSADLSTSPASLSPETDAIEITPEAENAPADVPEAESPAQEATGAVPAPDHMTKYPDAEDADPTADTFAAEEAVTHQKVQSESALMTVLRTLIGEETLKQLSAIQASEAENPQTLIRIFHIQREDFCRTAQDLQLTFTQEELDDLFELPLTEE